MYLFFVDESKAQSDQGYTIVGGLVINEKEYASILHGFNDIKRRHHILPSFEIGWSSMKRSESEKMDYGEREDLRKEIFKLVLRSEAILIASAVHLPEARKKGITEEFQSYCTGLMLSLERLQFYMQDQKKTINTICNSVVVAHRYNSPKDQKRVIDYCKSIAEQGTPRYEVRLDNILIKLLFGRADAVPALQISDYCMGGLRTFLEGGERKYYDMFDERFRRSPRNKITGYGIAFFPSASASDLYWPMF